MSKYIVDIHGEIEGDYEIVGKYEEQDPTTKNDLAVSSGLEKNSKKLEKDFGESDCISRAGVIKILGKIEHMVWEGEGFDYEESRAMIDELPSATPIRPKGHWITETTKHNRHLGSRNGYCSVCKNFYTDDWDMMNYCPNCGADMREVEE